MKGLATVRGSMEDVARACRNIELVSVPMEDRGMGFKEPRDPGVLGRVNREPSDLFVRRRVHARAQAIRKELGAEANSQYFFARLKAGLHESFFGGKPRKRLLV